MIPNDPETVIAWRQYELRNAAARAEYRHRDAQMQAADEQALRRLRLVTAATA